MTDFEDPKNLIAKLNIDGFENDLTAEENEDFETIVRPFSLSQYSVNEAKGRSRRNFYFQNELGKHIIDPEIYVEIIGHLCIDSDFRADYHFGIPVLFMFDEVFKKQYIKVFMNEKTIADIARSWDSYQRWEKIEALPDSGIEGVKEYIPVILTAKINFYNSVEYTWWYENKKNIRNFYDKIEKDKCLPYSLSDNEKEFISKNWVNDRHHELYTRAINDVVSWRFYKP